MVNGLDLVKKYFDGFDDCYTVIGGTALSFYKTTESWFSFDD